MKLLLALALVVVPTELLADTDPCELPRVLIVLDRSSSMVTGTTPEGVTKWDAAAEAVLTLVEAYAGRIEFGLMMFPDPDACGAGSILANVGADNAGLIATHLSEPPPTSGNFTPIAETLEAVLAEGLSWATASDSHVLLVTDGWQYCDPYDSATRFSAVDPVVDLTSTGVGTFILGFGSEVDVENNTLMALAGGTAPDDCDASATDPAATDLCYLQAGTGDELAAAFDAVAVTVVEEKCDGIDNDCDGFVDNDTPGDAAPLLAPCQSSCGTGTSTCLAGAWAPCDATGACDDADACTFDDWCADDECRGQPILCDDLDACTNDSCAPDSGCVHEPVPECGADPCDELDCDDGNPCTADGCAHGTCSHIADDEASCDDGDACTHTFCADGACIGSWICEPPEATGSPAKGGCGCGAAATPTALGMLLLLRRRRRLCR